MARADDPVTITDLQKTKAGRYSIFVDGEFVFSVDGETLLKSDIRKGKTLTIEYLEEVRQLSEYTKAKEKALDLLGVRPLSKRELVQKMQTKFPREVCIRVSEELAESGLMDDSDFAVRLAQELYTVRHCSVWEIGQKLREKGIAGSALSHAMEQEFDDRESIRALLAGKFAAASRRDPVKVVSALQRKGFHRADILSEIKLGEIDEY